MAIDSDNRQAGWFQQNDYLINKQVQVLLEDAQSLDELAKEVADEVANYLEGGSVTNWRVVQAALGNRAFRQMLIKLLVAGIRQNPQRADFPLEAMPEPLLAES